VLGDELAMQGVHAEEPGLGATWPLGHGTQGWVGKRPFPKEPAAQAAQVPLGPPWPSGHGVAAEVARRWQEGQGFVRAGLGGTSRGPRDGGEGGACGDLSPRGISLTQRDGHGVDGLARNGRRLAVAEEALGEDGELTAAGAAQAPDVLAGGGRVVCVLGTCGSSCRQGAAREATGGRGFGLVRGSRCLLCCASRCRSPSSLPPAVHPLPQNPRATCPKPESHVPQNPRATHRGCRRKSRCGPSRWP
jgi:hypothetical protein